MFELNLSHEQVLQAIKKRSEYILASDERSLEFMIQTGIYDNSGNLSKNYSDPNGIPQRDF
jgi:hypothetical protein